MSEGAPIREYVSAAQRRWRPAAALIIAGIGLSALISLVVPPTYEASTQLYVRTAGSGSISDLNQGGAFAQNIVSTYATVATTQAVLGPVKERLRLPVSIESLTTQITASAPLDQTLINISVRDSSPGQAARIANAVASSLQTWVTKTEDSGDAAAAAVSVSITQPASVPIKAAAPSLRTNMLIGGLIGLIAAVGAIVFLERVDTRVRNSRDLNGLNLNVLSESPFDATIQRNPLVTLEAPQSLLAESFRQLRTNLQFAMAGTTQRSLLLTSGTAGEGKSTAAVNLAVAIAKSGRKVVLLDADLRRPSIATYLGLEATVGLTSLLIGEVKLDDAIQQWGEDVHFSVIPSGPVPPNPSELLGTSAMQEVLAALEDRYDLVILDGAPLIPVTDSAVLASIVGTVVLVVRSGQARQREVERSLEILASVDSSAAGTVIAAQTQSDSVGYIRSYSAAQSPEVD